MKKILLALALCLPMTGCGAAKSTTPPAALAPGFSSQADQTMDQTLVGAHKFYTDIQSRVVAGTYAPDATEKTALNNFATALNAAQLVYIAFHASTATQMEAQEAVAIVTNQQVALQNTIGAK